MPKTGDGQIWKKEILNRKQDSLFAIYSWEVHDKEHGACEQIILKKNGRFKYSGYWPLRLEKFSEGNYLVHNKTIILNSDLQSDNIKADITYIDTITTDTLYSRLSSPRNNKGELIYKCYYYINNDSTLEGIFYPGFLTSPNLTRSIKNIKLRFWNTDFGSSWIPIQTNNKFISIKINTDKNFDNYTPEVLKNWRFRIYKNQLIRLKNFDGIKRKTVKI